MNKLFELESMNLKTNWTLIEIGFYGDGFIMPLLYLKEIEEYATRELESLNTGYGLVAQMVGDISNSYQFRETLKKLVKEEKVDRQLQIQKWRLYLAYRLTQELPGDYIKGLYEIADFWATLGWPDDCPNTIQGKGNDLSPATYYTKERYENEKLRISEWLRYEREKLIKEENG